MKIELSHEELCAIISFIEGSDWYFGKHKKYMKDYWLVQKLRFYAGMESEYKETE